MAESGRKKEEIETGSEEAEGGRQESPQGNSLGGMAAVDDASIDSFSHYLVRQSDRDPLVAPFVCGRLARRARAHQWLHRFAHWLGRPSAAAKHLKDFIQVLECWGILSGYSKLRQGAIYPADSENLKRLTNTDPDPQLEYEIDEWMGGDHETGDDSRIYRAMKYSWVEHLPVDEAQECIFDRPDDRFKYALGYILEDGICRYNSPSAIVVRRGGKANSIRSGDLRVTSVVTPGLDWVTDVRQLLKAVHFDQTEWLEPMLRQFEPDCGDTEENETRKRIELIENVFEVTRSRFAERSGFAVVDSLSHDSPMPQQKSPQAIAEPATTGQLICGPKNWQRKLIFDPERSRLYWAGTAEPFVVIESPTLVAYLESLIATKKGECRFTKLKSAAKSKSDQPDSIRRQITALNSVIKQIGIRVAIRDKKTPKATAVLRLAARESNKPSSRVNPSPA